MKTSYFKKLFFSLIALLTLNAACCWYADPFAIFHTAKTDPAKPYATDLFYQLRLTKSYQLEHLRPDYLILGSSRSAKIDPRPLRHGDGISYNSAIPGVTAYELWRYYRHAVVINTPKLVVVGLDYESFLIDEVKFRKGFDEYRLVETKEDLSLLPSLRRHFEDYLDTLISTDADLAGVTRMLRKNTSDTIFFSDGTWADDPTKRHMLTGKGGFKFITNQYFRQLSKQRPLYDLTYFKKIIDESCRNNIDIIFFISPVHNAMATVYQKTMHDKSRKQWQRELVRLVDGPEKACLSRNFALWGFENNDVSSLPPETKYLQTKVFFTDSQHLTREFSDEILSEMIGDNRPFLGLRLNLQNIDSYINDTSIRLINYQLTTGTTLPISPN